MNLFKQLPDSYSVVGRLCDILNLNEPDVNEAKYTLQFLSIPCVLANSERQRILRKHKSNDQQNTIRENERNNYKELNPSKKQALLENLQLRYKEMGPIKKQTLFKKLELKYNEMDPTNKQILLDNLHLK